MKKSEKEEYTYEKHHFYADKHAGKQVCAWCGLVALRNKASDWCGRRDAITHCTRPTKMQCLSSHNFSNKRGK